MILRMMVLLGLTGQSGAQAGIEILEAKSTSGGVKFLALVEPGVAPKEVLVGGPEGGTPASLRSPTVDLTLLVDVSALCRAEGIETRFQNLLSTLRGSLRRDSRVSVIAYSAESRLMLADRVQPSGLEDVRLLCTGRATSVGPEVAFPLVFREGAGGAMGVRQIWILSAGNVSLSAAALARIKSERVYLRTSIYSSVLYPALEPILKQLRAALPGQFSAGLWPVDTAPVIPIEIDWSAPIAWHGESRVATVKSGDASPVTVEVLVGPSWASKALASLSGPSGWMGFLALSLLAAMLIMGVLGPRKCRECRRPYLSEDGFCLECVPSDQPFLKAVSPQKTRFVRVRKGRARWDEVVVKSQHFQERTLVTAQVGGRGGEEVALPFYRPVQVGRWTLQLLPGKVP